MWYTLIRIMNKLILALIQIDLLVCIKAFYNTMNSDAATIYHIIGGGNASGKVCSNAVELISILCCWLFFKNGARGAR